MLLPTHRATISDEACICLLSHNFRREIDIPSRASTGRFEPLLPPPRAPPPHIGKERIYHSRFAI